MRWAGWWPSHYRRIPRSPLARIALTDEQWRAIIDPLVAAPAPPVTAHTFRQRWTSDSNPALFDCADGNAYVGVIAQSEGRVVARFLSNWERAADFGARPIGFLKRFAANITERPPSLAEVEHIAGRWDRVIQLSPPRGSTLAPEALLDHLARALFPDRPARLRASLSQTQAVHRTRKVLRETVASVLGTRYVREGYVRKDFTVAGSEDTHTFPAAIVNGHLLLAADAVSFQGVREGPLQRHLNSSYWKVEDTRRLNPTLEVGVVMFPPPAGDVTEKLHARPLPSSTISAAWR